MKRKSAPTGITLHIATPTLDRMLSVKEESQKVGNFIEWLRAQGYELAQYGKERGHRDTLFPVHTTTERLLAEYFEINLDEAERERCKILAGVRIAS